MGHDSDSICSACGTRPRQRRGYRSCPARLMDGKYRRADQNAAVRIFVKGVLARSNCGLLHGDKGRHTQYLPLEGEEAPA